MNDPYLSSALNAISSGPAWRDLADGPLAKRVAPKPVVIDLGRGPIQAMRERAALRAGFAEITEAVTGVPIIGNILDDLITRTGNLMNALGAEAFVQSCKSNYFPGPTGTILTGLIGGPIIEWDTNPLMPPTFSDTIAAPTPSVTAYDRNFEHAGSLAGIVYAGMLASWDLDADVLMPPTSLLDF